MDRLAVRGLLDLEQKGAINTVQHPVGNKPDREFAGLHTYFALSYAIGHDVQAKIEQTIGL
jgi:hypothetical protein